MYLKGYKFKFQFTGVEFITNTKPLSGHQVAVSFHLVQLSSNTITLGIVSDSTD